MTDLVIMKDRQAVTTSLQVAEVFEKNHRHVLAAVDELKEGVAENWADLFYEDTYTHPQNKQTYRQIIMNRDGFTLLAMGFTGKQALQFKLKYIDAFNKLESHIKQQLDTTNLSPELQMFQGLFTAVANQELATKRVETKLDNISEVVALNILDWRKDANNLINKVVRVQGGGEAHKSVRSEIYKEVERRAGANLQIRLTNLRRRMADEGVCKPKRDKLNFVDVIDGEKKLVEIYVAVVKDFAIKHKVWEE